MSKHQAPGADREENQTNAALELLRLRGAISDIALDEGRLKMQEGQLQTWLARYRSEAQQAQASQDEALAARALQQLDTLYPQLASVQEQLARLQAQKTALTQQQQALLAKLNISSSEAARTITSADSGVAWSPAPPSRQALSRRRQRLTGRPVFWFSAILVLLVIVVAVVSVLHGSFLSTFLPTGGTPFATPTPAGPVFSPNGTGPADATCPGLCYNPEQIQQAFGLNAIYRKGFEGQGQTIVVLGAGKTTTLKSDLTHFDQAWGLPDPDLKIIQPHGPPVPYTCPDGNDDLQFENTLDVEWAHAIAPAARIVLVIGDNSPGSSKEHCIHWSLAEDVTYALDHHLGNIISISYAGSELGDITRTPGERAGEQTYYRDADAIFKRAAKLHVTVVASAGDEGATSRNDLTKTDSYWNRPSVEWPASDPYMLGVGGTSLTIADPTGIYNGESVWSAQNYNATGGGRSVLFPEPTYQKQAPNQAMFKGKRGVPDVSFPAEDFLVYESEIPWDTANTNPQFNHWYLAGGTSMSAPCWAGLIALANQMYQKPLGFIQPALYSMSGEGMHDITIGDNTFAGVQGYQAQPGYDLASGWGTPIADEFIPALIQAAFALSPGCKHLKHLCTWRPAPN